MDYRENHALLIRQFLYDANGNLTHHPAKDMTIEYNLINLPSEIIVSGKTSKYEYTFNGQKFKHVSLRGRERLYLGSVEMVDGEIEQFKHPEGRFMWINLLSSKLY